MKMEAKPSDVSGLWTVGEWDYNGRDVMFPDLILPDSCCMRTSLVSSSILIFCDDRRCSDIGCCVVACFWSCDRFILLFFKVCCWLSCRLLVNEALLLLLLLLLLVCGCGQPSLVCFKNHINSTELDVCVTSLSTLKIEFWCFTFAIVLL